MAPVIGRIELIGAERGPREIVIDAVGLVRRGGAAHAHGPGAGRAEIVAERAAEGRLRIVRERDHAAFQRAAAAGRLPLDLHLDAVRDDIALLVHLEDAPGEIDADAPRVRAGGPLDKRGIRQRAAAFAIHVAGDEGERAGRIAALELDLLVGAERRLADAEIVDGEIAEAEVENLMEVLLAVHDFGVFGRAEIGEHAMGAEDEQQRLIGARAIGAGAEAVDVRGRSARLRQGRIRRAGRRQRIHDQPAGDGDGGTGERLRP